jgi:hypothetical protein
MNDAQIKTLATRLSRPHPSGGVVIERAALLAAGSDFAAMVQWITAHAGTPEATAPTPAGHGLHGAHVHQQHTAQPVPPHRFVLPAGIAE